MTAIDRTPLSVMAVWEPSPFTLRGYSWTFIGEDGEIALMRDHVAPALLVEALTAETGCEYDVADVTHEWWLFTRHMPACDADDEPCQCLAMDSFDWWGTKADVTTTGALPVTMWSA